MILIFEFVFLVALSGLQSVESRTLSKIFLIIFRNKLGLSCAKLTVVWLGLKLSNELKIEDENVGDE